MKSGRCDVLPISLSLLAGLVGLFAEVRAQGQSGSGDAMNIVNASGPKNPVHKLNEVPSTDPVVLRGVKRAAANSAESAAAEKSAAPGAPRTENAATADDTQKKVAEIASLEKQIQDKMKRITLLMRLFVKDKKPFIVDPANPRGDEAAQEQRKYEQDELLWETSELAKLKARLDAITAAK